MAKTKRIDTFEQIKNSKNFLFFSIFYFVFFAVNQIYAWPLLRIWDLKASVNFADLRAILKNVECFSKIGWSIYKKYEGNSCYNYMYGSNLIRVFKFFHLGLWSANFIGWTFIVLISGIFAKLTAEFFQRYNSFVVPILFFCSPPIYLLLERANLDSLMLFGVVITVSLYKRQLYLVALSVIIIVSSFKFYTFVLIPIYLCAFKKWQTKILLFLCATLCLFNILFDIQRAGSIQIGGANDAFGIAVWANYAIKFGYKFNFVQAEILGILVLFLAIILVFLLHKYFRIQKTNVLISSEQRVDGFSYINFLLVFLGCYVSGLNFDYRLIYLILATIIFLNKYEGSNFPKRIVALQLFVVWFSCNVYERYQVIGSVALLFLVAEYILTINFSILRELKKKI